MIAGLDSATVPFWGVWGEAVGDIEVGLHVPRREDRGTGTGDGVGKKGLWTFYHNCVHSSLTF